MKVSELLAELEGVPLDAEVVIWSEEMEHFWKPWVSHVLSSDSSRVAFVEICFDPRAVDSEREVKNA
jgi:hypothetical protein